MKTKITVTSAKEALPLCFSHVQLSLPKPNLTKKKDKKKKKGKLIKTSTTGGREREAQCL
jgi:hypothetical protein